MQIDPIVLVRNWCHSWLSLRRELPLLPDGYAPTSRHAFEWDQKKISNFAAQQNFLRLLTSLSSFTGDPIWHDFALATAKWHMNCATDPKGLLVWGSHAALNFDDGTIVAAIGKPLVHELKGAYPFYELLTEADQPAFRRFVSAQWNAHVAVSRGRLHFDRHGKFRNEGESELSKLAEIPVDAKSATTALSFISAGSDLIWSSACLARLDESSWGAKNAIFLHRHYLGARNPTTNIGGYQFGELVAREAPKDDTDVRSRCGDRAKRQFGPDFGAVFERDVLLEPQATSIYGKHALMSLELARIHPSLKTITSDVLASLESFILTAFDWDTARWRPILADGTLLNGYRLKRDGYYGVKNHVFSTYESGFLFLSTARAALLQRSSVCWQVFSRLARAADLGYIGRFPDAATATINLSTTNTSALAAIVLSEFYDAFGDPQFLAGAQSIVANILNNVSIDASFPFLREGRTYAAIDDFTPLAVLKVCASASNKGNLVERYVGGRSDFHSTTIERDTMIRKSNYISSALYT